VLEERPSDDVQLRVMPNALLFASVLDPATLAA